MTITLQYTTYITLLSLLLSFTKFFFLLILRNIKLTNKAFKTKFRREIKRNKEKNGKRDRKRTCILFHFSGD